VNGEPPDGEEVGMDEVNRLLENNREWAARVHAADPGFFATLARRQTPHYLWIGCSDSRVPASTIVGLKPGDLFVHRNIANLIVHSDLNALSVLQFAVDVLRVRHVIVCGHYGCGGVKAAMGHAPLGLIDHWLRHIRDLHAHHAAELVALTSDAARLDRMCELNVLRQVQNVARTGIVQDAWRRGQQLAVHGWIYHIQDGLLADLATTVDGPHGIPPLFRLGE
jgi:carbonic anhydrase